ncbi:MAG: NADH-quinone oxidoreductase subunit C [Dehalococcoidia bacterium]
MTSELSSASIAERLRAQFPDLDPEVGPNWVRFGSASVLDVCRFVRDDPELDFVYLTCLTAVDQLDFFEIVYHLQSLRRNHIGVIKAKVDREQATLPSVSSVWYGAHLQETEAYDLMGIRFEGHPNLRRIFLWEGFAGWPLRKDFLQVERGAFKPGLPYFPKEGGERPILSGPNWTAPPPAPRRSEG